MASSHSDLDAQIEKLRNGDTLPEHEVKALCDKVCVFAYGNGTGNNARNFPGSERKTNTLEYRIPTSGVSKYQNSCELRI